MTTIRLSRVAHGHPLTERLVLGLFRLMSGRPAPDVVRALLYRRRFWGDRFSALLQAVMRGPSSPTSTAVDSEPGPTARSRRTSWERR